MAQTVIIHRNAWANRPARNFSFGKNAAGEEEFAVFDSVISEAHTFEVAIPDDPIETGGSVSDHAYLKPRKLDMEVAVSDTPLISDGQGTPAVQIATTWSDGGKTRRSVLAWEYCEQKAEEFALFDVQTGLKLYRNMMFETGAATTTKETAGCLRAAFKLKQITFASTRTVEFPPRGPAKTKRAGAAKANDGRKEATESKPQEKKPASLLHGLLGLGNK